MRHFGSEDRLSRSEEMLSTELDHETVLMSIDAGAYYGLEGVARSIWESLETPLTFSALVDRMVGAYEVGPDICSADLQRFLAEMEREGLLRVE
jgi:hypothetical protein